MITKTLLTTLAIFACFNMSAVGEVITPTGASSTSTVGIPRTIDKAIDGSGLTDVSDPASVLDDSHAYDGTAYWLSASSAVSSGTEELTFNLGGTFDVDTVHYWTYERDGDRNIKTFDISYSTDGGATFSTPVSATSLNMADWAIGGSARDPSLVRTATFDTLSGVTNIRFSNLQNHGDPSYIALYEIRFGGVSGGPPAGPVDPGQSTVLASPTTVPANDIATSTVTVAVKNSIGLPLAGKVVSLSGDGSATIDPAGPGTDTTDASGEATFTVRSGIGGLETFTATSESVTITQTAAVDFIAVPTGDVITPTAATSASTVGGDRTIDKVIDGSGLTDVSDPSSVLDDSHAYDGTAYWLSASSAVSSGTEELTFDLGGAFNVDRVYYWTYERDGDRNLRTFDISFSTDTGSTFSTPVSAASLNMEDWVLGGSDRDPSFVRTAAFDTLPGVTHIRFSNLQNHGDPSYFALYEVRFGGPLAPALITNFEAAGATGVINQLAKTIALEVPFGTDLSTLAPTFTLSSGTCNQTSGVIPSPDFGSANPVTYTVTDISTDPDTVNPYTVTVTEGPKPPATLVIDLGVGTTIEGGEFIGTGPTNLPLPGDLPEGSILRGIEVNVTLTATDNGTDGNFSNEFAILLDPSPGSPGGDFSLGITSAGANQDFGGLGETLEWSGGSGGVGTTLEETKTEADWAGDIDLATTGLFLGNAYRDPDWVSPQGGTWSGTITLTYDDVSGGGDYASWSGGAAADGDANGDGVQNAVAYALGAEDVNKNAIGLLPGFDNSNPDDFVFSFDRSDAAEADATTTITVEYGTTLTGWKTAPDAGDGVTVDDSGASVGGLTPVIVTIPKTLAPDGKLFARLKVVSP